MMWILGLIFIVLCAVYIWAMIDAAPEIGEQFEEQARRLRNEK